VQVRKVNGIEQAAIGTSIVGFSMPSHTLDPEAAAMVNAALPYISSILADCSIQSMESGES
jgi:hypothetical protein